MPAAMSIESEFLLLLFFFLQIDEGWMMGKVLRTGLSGMVPANYVEPIN